MKCKPLTYIVGLVTTLCKMFTVQILLWSMEFVSLKESQAQDHQKSLWFHIRTGKNFSQQAQLLLVMYYSTVEPAFTCSKLIIETLEQGVKYVQS